MMSKIYGICFLSLTSLSTAAVAATITVCNETDAANIYFACAATEATGRMDREFEVREWTARGWYNIAKQNCTTITLPPGHDGSIHYYATDGTRSWPRQGTANPGYCTDFSQNFRWASYLELGCQGHMKRMMDYAPFWPSGANPRLVISQLDGVAPSPPSGSNPSAPAQQIQWDDELVSPARGLSLTGRLGVDICINANPLSWNDHLSCPHASAYSPIEVPQFGLQPLISHYTSTIVYHQTNFLPTTPRDPL